MERKYPKYTVVDGFNLPAIVNKDVFRDVSNYQPCSNDVFIATFPKSGTTWVQQIIYLIYSSGQPPASGMEFHNRSPFLEVMGVQPEKRIHPDTLKTHLPFGMIPYSPKAKYIVLFRNPKDCCVSFYYHSKRATSYQFQDGTFEDFFELFMEGGTDYGDYFNHLLGWYDHREDLNVLQLTYEALKTDFVSSIFKIANFLGGKYLDRVKDPVLLKEILKFSSFDYMKEVTKDHMLTMHLMKCGGKSRLDPGFKSVIVARKGVVGSWQEVMSIEQSERMDVRIFEKIGHTALYKYWVSIGCI